MKRARQRALLLLGVVLLIIGWFLSSSSAHMAFVRVSAQDPPLQSSQTPRVPKYPGVSLEAEDTLEKALGDIETSSLALYDDKESKENKIGWAGVKEKAWAEAEARHAQTPADIYPIIQKDVLGSLRDQGGDYHSHLFVPSVVKGHSQGQWWGFGLLTAKTRSSPPETIVVRVYRGGPADKEAHIEDGDEVISEDKSQTDILKLTIKHQGQGRPPITLHAAYFQLNTDQDLFGERLPGNVGYLEVPEFFGGSNDMIRDYAQRFQDLTKKIDTAVLGHPVCVWIVGLRLTLGGSGRAILLALGPLLVGRENGEALVAGFDSPLLGKRGIYYNPNNGELRVPSYHNGQWEDSSTIKVDRPYRVQNPEAGIIVNISRFTGSASELATQALSPQPLPRRTRRIGDETNGNSTGNADFDLPGGAELYVESSYMTDRMWHYYEQRHIPPGGNDENIVANAQVNWQSPSYWPRSDNTNMRNDPVIEADLTLAQHWCSSCAA